MGKKRGEVVKLPNNGSGKSSPVLRYVLVVRWEDDWTGTVQQHRFLWGMYATMEEAKSMGAFLVETCGYGGAEIEDKMARKVTVTGYNPKNRKWTKRR